MKLVLASGIIRTRGDKWYTYEAPIMKLSTSFINRLDLFIAKFRKVDRIQIFLNTGLFERCPIKSGKKSNCDAVSNIAV